MFLQSYSPPCGHPQHSVETPTETSPIQDDQVSESEMPSNQMSNSLTTLTTNDAGSPSGKIYIL